eukprot:TRINITY_DN17584_c0_g1_i3.p1 TRINITY_DN17584_c0_g1~~TRINITY_DN17584_c0_g1_i3.p1  ORF type:complete len:151 (+),score=54.99 TRINITY_DN17584_c0_g1_i3:33-455(+)
MSDAVTIQKIEKLPYETTEQKSAVLVASITQDFSSIVNALENVDKELLAKTLVAHSTAKKEDGLSLKELDSIKELALSSTERDAMLNGRERELEPCTLNEEERQKLFAECEEKITAAFKEAQDVIVRLGMKRDALEPVCG